MMRLKKRQIAVVAGITAIVIISAVTAAVNFHKDKASEAISVSDEEITQYKEMIGTDMDEKRAVFVMFNTLEECTEFINEHGADKNPERAGIGISPIMKDGYYNIVGKAAFEEAFNALSDGEYAKEPVMYSGKYCYFKRIGLYSPMASDDEIRELIRHDKEYLVDEE